MLCAQAINMNKLYSKENGGFCVRIYNEYGEHVLSFIPCSVEENGDIICWDLATPNGEVLCCNIENELIDSFAGILGFDEINWKFK